MACSLSAMRQVEVGDNPIYRDRRTLASTRTSCAALNSRPACGPCSIPTWPRASIPTLLIAPAGDPQQPALLAPLIDQVQQQRQEATALLHWSGDAADDESVHAIPLNGQDNQLLGILLVGNTRRPYVELALMTAAATPVARAARRRNTQ